MCVCVQCCNSATATATTTTTPKITRIIKKIATEKGANDSHRRSRNAFPFAFIRTSVVGRVEPNQSGSSKMQRMYNAANECDVSCIRMANTYICDLHIFFFFCFVSSLYSCSDSNRFAFGCFYFSVSFSAF